MISFMEFVNKVESANPPILKKYKKRIRLTALQGIGLCLLTLFSVFIPIGLYNSYDKNGRLMEDDIFVVFFFLIALGIGWTFSIYSLKHFTFKEKRKIYNPSSSTKWWDRLVIVLTVFIFLFGCTGILPDFASVAIALLSILGAIGYFLSPWRERQVNNGIPLYQLLSVLGWEQKTHDKRHPFFFSKHGIKFDYNAKIPCYFCFNLNGIPAYIGCIQFWENYGKNSELKLETITFNIPKYAQDRDVLLKNVKQFILSFTGQDLFFHKPIFKHFIEEKLGRLEISISVKGDIEEFMLPIEEWLSRNKDKGFPKLSFRTAWNNIFGKQGTFTSNLYHNTYFYYTREDLDTIYKDVQTLVNAIDDRYF